MNTEIVIIEEENIDREAITRAGKIIKAGGLVALPTETVYGIGGDALNASSSEKIYAAKGRPSDNPLIVHITRIDALSFLVKEIPETAYKLADKFWPGPLTMIFHKSDHVPKRTTGGLETVAVRMPSNKVAGALIEAAGGYIAAPSANRSGRPSPTVAKYVIEDLDGRVDMIIDGGESVIGLESTIVDLTEEKPVILRPGYITKEMIAAFIGNVDVDRAITDEACSAAPKAPGMKYRHYAPEGSLMIVEGAAQQVEAYINERLKSGRAEGKRTGVIATDETAGHYHADSIKSVGSRSDKEQIARHLFRILREFDDENIQVIYTESFEQQGVGAAIMNRLLKAAGHRVVSL